MGHIFVLNQICEWMWFCFNTNTWVDFLVFEKHSNHDNTHSFYFGTETHNRIFCINGLIQSTRSYICSQSVLAVLSVILSNCVFLLKMAGGRWLVTIGQLSSYPTLRVTIGQLATQPSAGDHRSPSYRTLPIQRQPNKVGWLVELCSTAG
jgi:hypothetical protein